MNGRKSKISIFSVTMATALAIFGMAIGPGAEAATPTWDQYCSGCHGSASSFGPRTVAQIQTALTNINSMKNSTNLKTLTAAQIQTISNELSGTSTVNPPVISSFTSTPGSITSGQSTRLSWTLSGGAPTTLSIDNSVGSVLGSTFRDVTPGATTTYTLTASNSAGTVSQPLTVTVTAPPPVVTAPVINSFTSNPGSVTSGQSSTLSWSLSGGAPTTLSIDNGVGSVLGLTSKAVTPGATTTYTLTASNSAGSATKSVTVTITASPPVVTAPVISSFTSNPGSVTSGQLSTLSWSLSGGAPTTLSIDNGVGSVLGLTSKAVTPGATTTYALTASNSAGSATKSVTVTVTATPQAPQPPAVDLKNWPGQWLKVTIKYDGYYYGQSNSGVSSEDESTPGMAKDHESTGAYLKVKPLDPNQPDALQADLYQYDTKSGQWVSDPLTLRIIGGTSTDFLCWSQVNGDFTGGFTARIKGKEKGGTLQSATFKTLGGYYYESSSGNLAAGGISINGNLVPESKVPVPK